MFTFMTKGIKEKEIHNISLEYNDTRKTKTHSARERTIILERSTQADKILKNTFKRAIGNHDSQPFTLTIKTQNTSFLA